MTKLEVQYPFNFENVAHVWPTDDESIASTINYCITRLERYKDWPYLVEQNGNALILVYRFGIDDERYAYHIAVSKDYDTCIIDDKGNFVRDSLLVNWDKYGGNVSEATDA